LYLLYFNVNKLRRHANGREEKMDAVSKCQGPPSTLDYRLLLYYNHLSAKDIQEVIG
jgi:hypothetical protein